MGPDFDFDRETAVTRLGDGRFAATLDPSWSVFRGPNGGYLAALALRALTVTVDDPVRAARSLTMHYATAPEPGEIEIRTRVERTGRSLTSCSARLVQGDRLVGIALAAFSAPRPGPSFTDLLPPEVPGPEDCAPRVLSPDDEAQLPPIARRWETRWAIGSPPGSQSAQALAGGWIRLPEGHVADAIVVAAMTDGWVPPLFSRVDAPMVVPTVDLTIHFRTALPTVGARPDDWVLARFRTDAAADGFLEEDGALWSGDGSLLAQSRQLAVMLALG